eukprot:scaffold2248_cov261-Pinguiococcus_pyrenoidosus.AAC.8
MANDQHVPFRVLAEAGCEGVDECAFGVAAQPCSSFYTSKIVNIFPLFSRALCQALPFRAQLSEFSSEPSFLSYRQLREVCCSSLSASFRVPDSNSSAQLVEGRNLNMETTRTAHLKTTSKRRTSLDSSCRSKRAALAVLVNCHLSMTEAARAEGVHPSTVSRRVQSYKAKGMGEPFFSDHDNLKTALEAAGAGEEPSFAAQNARILPKLNCDQVPSKEELLQAYAEQLVLRHRRGWNANKAIQEIWSTYRMKISYNGMRGAMQRVERARSRYRERLKWSVVSAMDGLVVDFCGPVGASRHDSYNLDWGNFLERFAAQIPHPFSAFGDAAYSRTAEIERQHRNPSGILRWENTILGARRITVEWTFTE